ncbi:MAG: tetratricopeptide repeat protein [Anaerolineales bacterium]
MNVEQVAARLDDRFRLLTGGSRNALPRHQTLRALIDWSFDLLSEKERILFRRLSVFAGGWTLEAAEEICSGNGIDLYDVMDILAQLVNKSLVIPDRDSEHETRYRMLETIRQYAREKLFEAGEGDHVREKHLDYFLVLTEKAEPELRGQHQVVWLNRLEREVDNIRGALEWAVEDQAEVALRMASALFWFWHIRSRKSEGIEWLERGLVAHPVHDPSTSQILIHGKAMNVASSLLVMHGSPERGNELSNQSMVLHERLGPDGRRGVAHALWNLAQGAAHHEDVDLAQELSEQALAIFRELNDKFGIAQCLDNLGSHKLMKGEYAQAKTLWQEDLALRRELKDKDGIGWVLTCLAEQAFWQGDLETGFTLYADAKKAFRDVGNKWAVSMTISGMGSIMLAKGDFEQATKLYEEALAFGRDMGDLNAIAGRRYDLARVAWSRGDYDKAARIYEDTLEFIRREFNNKGAIAGTLFELGEVAWAQGNHALATKRYEGSLTIAREIKARFTAAAALNGLGKVASLQGDYRKANQLHKEALMLLETTGNRWNIAFTLEAFASLAVAEGNMERAARLYGATESFYTQIHYLTSPLDRENHERNIATARDALGAETFERLWASGKTLTFDQMIQYALEV